MRSEHVFLSHDHLSCLNKGCCFYDFFILWTPARIQSAIKVDFSHSVLWKMCIWSMPYISWTPLLIKIYLFFFFLFLNFELNENPVSHTHIHTIWFLISSQYFSELCLLYSIYKTVQSPSLSVYYKYLFSCNSISLKLMPPRDWMWWNK